MPSRARIIVHDARGRARRRTAGSAPAFATTFAALGDQTRLRLLARLSARPGADGAMSITKHLRVMEHAGLVRSKRRGRERIWQLRERRLAEARHYLAQISRQWDDTLNRLRNFVES
ncbi:MAG: hypothetical protein WBY73_09415 [Candidatus Acidiferrales bacterium]